MDRKGWTFLNLLWPFQNQNIPHQRIAVTKVSLSRYACQLVLYVPLQRLCTSIATVAMSLNESGTFKALPMQFVAGEVLWHISTTLTLWDSIGL